MKNLQLTLLFIFGIIVQINAQVKGYVSGIKNEKLTNVNIYLANQYNGTTTNTNGAYELAITKTGKHSIIFQYLGYKTLKKDIFIEKFPYNLNVTLEESEVSLDIVNINTKINPAIAIIKKTIAQQKQNLSRINEYTCDFYSKGIYSVKNAPKKMFGQDLDDFFVGLDSARNGIVYLSESMSKVKFKAPNNFKEHMLASKVSGRKQSFSFNSASEFNFSFYENTIELEETDVISPLAKFAFSYYNYTLEDLFYENGIAINKIKVSPKRSQDKVFEGYIYIVDEQWELYGVDLKVNGKQLQSIAFEEMVIKQNFRNDTNQDFWTMISQTMDFKFKFLKLQGYGTFTAMYSNYNFNPEFDKNSFTKEVFLVEKGANKKKDSFWEISRPIQLTKVEKKDYKYKDSVQVIRESKVYLDSIDNKNNKFKFGDLLLGYNYKNSYEKWSWGIRSPLFAIQYNTVQGWNSNINLYYNKWNKEKGSRSSLSTKINYGLSDEQFRLSGSFYKMFNNFSKPILQVSGGRKLNQFNKSEPIKPIENSVSTLFFENNYAKFYDNIFGEIRFEKEYFNGFRGAVTASHEIRKPLLNTTGFVIINDEEKNYTSNNPLASKNFSKGFKKHNISKVILNFTYRPGQEYSMYPNGKYNNSYFSKKPLFKLGIESALAASKTEYKHTKFEGEISQNIKLSNKGKFRYNISGGLYVDGENIDFIDFNHFNGNQIHFTQNNNLKKFSLLPYYSLSTNKAYAELHAEHNFKGYILDKIPLLNKLNFNLVVSSHIAFLENNKPYSEYAIGLDNVGWGKVRFLRVDLVKSFHHGISETGLMFGLKLN
jgi:hypothetical protein